MKVSFEWDIASRPGPLGLLVGAQKGPVGPRAKVRLCMIQPNTIIVYLHKDDDENVNESSSMLLTSPWSS